MSNMGKNFLFYSHYHTFMVDLTLLINVTLTIFQSVSTFLQIDSTFQTPASQPVIFSLLLEIRI